MSSGKLSHMSLDSGIMSSISSTPAISRGGPIKATLRPKALTENTNAKAKVVPASKPCILTSSSLPSMVSSHRRSNSLQELSCDYSSTASYDRRPLQECTNTQRSHSYSVPENRSLLKSLSDLTVPLNVDRLKPLEHKTKTGLIKITEDQCVSVQFNSKGSGKDKSEMMVVSTNGIKVIFVIV